MRDSSLFADRSVPVSPLLPPNAMALSSLGSLGFRCSLRLDVEEDLPRLKNDRQLPTGDFFDFIGCLFLYKNEYHKILKINIYMITPKQPLTEEKYEAFYFNSELAYLSVGNSMTVWNLPCKAAGPSPTSIYLLSAVTGELIWACVRA